MKGTGEDLLIIGVSGSPREMKSRTRMILRWVLTGAAAAGAKTEPIDLTSLRFEACTACESCSLTGALRAHRRFPVPL